MVEVLFLQGRSRQAVDLLKCPVYGLRHLFNGQTGAQLPQVHHAGTHRIHALAGDLGGGGAEIPSHLRHVGIHQQCAVVERPAVVGVKGVAGELPPLGQQIVAPGQLRSESQQAAGRENDLLLPVEIVVFLCDAEGEVQVAQIVKHRAAAGEPPRQHTALLLQKAGAALLPGVLVAANDHRILILP